MPLKSNTSSPVDETSLDCIKFSMTDSNGLTVFCVITAQALRDLSPDNEQDLKKIFIRERAKIEAKASKKFDELGGSGRKEIIITNSDA